MDFSCLGFHEFWLVLVFGFNPISACSGLEFGVSGICVLRFGDFDSLSLNLGVWGWYKTKFW